MGVAAGGAGAIHFFALIPGGRGDTLLWEVHQDTVSVRDDGASFEAAVRDGGLRRGRDVKGSMASMLALRAGPRPTGGRSPQHSVRLLDQ